MKHLKILQLKFLLWIVNWEKEEIITEEEEIWLHNCYKDPGFGSYCKVRNLEILKSIALATEKRDFQRAIELNGQRIEILRLQARAQRYYRKATL